MESNFGIVYEENGIVYEENFYDLIQQKLGEANKSTGVIEIY